MKKNNIYDALSGIDEKYLERSEDFNEIKSQFKRSKIHMAEKYVSLAACLAFSVIVGLNVFEKNDITQRTSMIDPSYINEQHSLTETAPEVSEGSQHTTVLKENIKTSSVSTNSKENANTDKTTVKPKETSANIKTRPTVIQNDDIVTKIPSESAVIPATNETTRTTVFTAATVKTTAKPPVSNIPVSSVTQPEKEPPATNIVINPVYNSSIDDDISTDIRDISSDGNWDDMQIYEKFDLIVFNDTDYLTDGKIISTDKVGDKIGDMKVSGYDPYKYKTNYSDIEVFRINDIPETQSVAVRFKEQNGYYIYTIADNFYSS